MIEVNGLVKRFDGFAALDGAALSVPAGSVYGLVGPNGAGKSTLIRHLTGIFRQDAGTVRIGGEDVWENAALKARIAAIPDDWYYFLQSSIRDMMRFYRGFYPAFSMERYEKLKEVFQLDEKRPIRRLRCGLWCWRMWPSEAPRCWFLPTTCGSWRTCATMWASWTTAACCWSGPWPSCRTTW